MSLKSKRCKLKNIRRTFISFVVFANKKKAFGSTLLQEKVHSILLEYIPA